MAQRHGRRRPSFELHRTNDSPEAVMSPSLRIPSRLLAALGATVTMFVMAAGSAAALVPPPDPSGGSGTRPRMPAPAMDAASSHVGLALAVIVATTVVALAVAGTLSLRAGRTAAARQAGLQASTTR
jgi:hypothetical protein